MFVQGDPSCRDIRPEVVRSWKKCLGMGLDPLRNAPPPVVSGNELGRPLRDNRDLIEIATPVMDLFEIYVRETGFVVSLSEQTGCVLLVSRDTEIMEMAGQTYYQPGCIRDVEHPGTNAIEVCLMERKPLQLTGAEHFNMHFHP